MIKGIKISGASADRKIDVIAKIFFEPLSSTELSILKSLINFSSGNSITLTPHLSKQLISDCNTTQSSFNTCLHRLEKKGLFYSNGKTKNLHPRFNNILEWDKILLGFDEDKIVVKNDHDISAS